jgi:exopolysaccharide production protein ExoQ
MNSRLPKNPARSPTGAAVASRTSLVMSLFVWLMVLLMTLPKDFVSLFADPPAPSASAAGATLNSILWLVLFVAAPIYLVQRTGMVLRLLRSLNVFFIAFFLLVLLSITWSAAPDVTFDRFRRLVIIVCCCMAVALVGWNPRQFQNLLRPVLTAFVAGSIVYGLVFPELAIHHQDSYELRDAWHGLAYQKNVFGALATYTVILWLHAALSRQAAWWKALLFGGLGLVCVRLSHSSTSLLISIFSIFLLFLTMRSPPALRRYMPYIIGLFVVLVALYVLAVLGLVPALQSLLDPITSLTGKNAREATGRAPIWELIELEIARHPWLGIGYGAYWVGPIPGTASYVFVTAIFFYAASSHSGYLEVTNDLGYVGLACLIGYVLVYVRQSMRLWRTDRNQAALYLALIFQQGLENLSEAEWLQVTSVNFIITTLATFTLARNLLDESRPAPRVQRAPAHPARRAMRR